MTRYFAIKDNKIVSEISCIPFSKENMDKFCKDFGFDDWIELTEDAVLKICMIKK